MSSNKLPSLQPLLIAATGLLCFISLPTSNVMTVLLVSVVCVAMAFLPVFWAIPTEILSDSKAAVAVGTINALASLAGFGGRTRSDIFALKPDLSPLDSWC